MTTIRAEPITPPVKTPPLQMNYEEWRAWDYEGSLTEWENGEVIIHMATTKKHQSVVEFLLYLLGLFVQLFRLGEVHTAPYPMRSKPDGNAREPDLLFVGKDKQALATDDELMGPADLVVEVVSDDSVARDLDKKFYEYEEAGVREYWIIDPRPRRRRAFFYVLDESGHYQLVKVGADGIYHSTVVPSFWLKVDWLWSEQSNPLNLLAQIVGVEKLTTMLK